MFGVGDVGDRAAVALGDFDVVEHDRQALRCRGAAAQACLGQLPIGHNSHVATILGDAKWAGKFPDKEGGIIDLNGHERALCGQYSGWLPGAQICLRVGAAHFDAEWIAADVLSAACEHMTVLSFARTPACDLDVSAVCRIEPESSPGEREQCKNP